MHIRMEDFFKDENVIVFAQDQQTSKKISLNSLHYPSSLESNAHSKKASYFSIYSELKKKVTGIFSSSESEFDKTRRKVLSEARKDGIAQAILAMRNQLIKQARHVEIEKAYKEGYNIPQKSFNVELGNDVRNNIAAIKKIREEYEGDVDGFIESLSEKVDNLIEDREKSKADWTWAALLTALAGGLSALEYRLALIAIEPYRLAFRAGAIHGTLVAVEEKEIKIKKWLWETTGEHPCDHCISLDGTEVSIEEAERFAHPNCQCTLTIVV